MKIFTTLPKGTVIADKFTWNDKYFVLGQGSNSLYVNKEDVEVLTVAQ